MSRGDEVRRRLAERLRDVGAGLHAQRIRAARQLGFAHGLELMPRLALGLVLAWFALTAIDEAPAIPAWSLPLLLCLAPLASVVAIARREQRRAVATYEAALAYDEAQQTGDRLSAAYELAPAAPADPVTRRFAAAAVEDGVQFAERSALARVAQPLAAFRARFGVGLLGLAIACLPWILGAWSSSRPPRPELPIGPVAAAPEQAGAQEAPATRDATELPEPPARDPGAAARGTEGSAQAGQAPGERGRPVPGDAQAGQQGSATPGAGSGGQGQASRSRAPVEPTPSQSAAKPAKPRTPDAESPRELGTENAAAPGGPARASGRMAPVTNQRPGLDRGPERDDAPPSEDEEIEDETEESEQRGGLMPMGRDRQQPPTRELSISGDGPPDDGRGGPTPPKKSRGTASLVLGLRLPDHVRGRPNPGTAKTSLAPRPAQAEPGVISTPAPGNGAPASPQSHELRSELDALVGRYHELLRQRNP